MGLFFNKNQMTPEEQTIHNEVKANFSNFNDRYNEFQKWLNRTNEPSSTFKKVLSCKELDNVILEKTSLGELINALDEAYPQVVAKAQPFNQFMEKIRSKNIKFNNLNANEKSLIREPLGVHLQLLNEWHELRKEFDKKVEKVYEGIITYFDEVEIHNINVYALKRMDIPYEEKNDIVSKVKRIESIYAYADSLVDMCENSLPEVLYLYEEDDKDDFWVDNIKELILLHRMVQAKFPPEKGEDSFFSTVDKKLKNAKKMFYYFNGFEEITNYLDILHKKAVDAFLCYTTIDDDDSSEELQELEISLQEALILIGVSPQYLENRICIEEASYGGRTITKREVMIGKNLFSEINDMLVSIEFFEDYEMDLEEELVAETLGYDF